MWNMDLSMDHKINRVDHRGGGIMLTAFHIVENVTFNSKDS